MSSDITHPGPVHGTVEYATSRPRVLGWLRSAAILDGDWGTSIAYVLGIGFALAGYSSMWHLAGMLALTSIVALNYITICRLYPNGGGVYSSVYHRSRRLAVVGALLLGADYVITMSLSVLEAFHYFGIDHAVGAAIATIMVIGVLNWFGPKHSGGGAGVISAVTLVSLLVIILVSAPTALREANVEPPHDTFLANWGIFVGLILSISGIEAISNMTGLMKDPARDSRRAIIAVLGKVIVATIFLGLAMHAIPGLSGGTEDMVRVIGEHYVGVWFGWVIAISLGLLLISAGNTAMNGLISVQFLMAIDGELPTSLRRLNRHGVPVIPLVIATTAPVVVLLFVNDILTLASLYAIGVVGAVMINIGSTATDRSLSIGRVTRAFMVVVAVILFFIEVSIAIEKSYAALFAGIVLAVGLTARMISQRARARERAAAPAAVEPSRPPIPPQRRVRRAMPTTKYLVATKGANEKLLKFAIEEAKARKAFLFILNVKEIAVGALPERIVLESNGVEARIQEICEQSDIDYQYLQVPSYEVGYTIAEQAATFGVERLIIGAERRNRLENVLKGSVMRSLGGLLPDDIQLVIFGG
ncbi:MAG: universal stress protein [Bacteroidetes bacterium]|nr:universal stress protein [Bacteroidota bacterium]